MKKCLLSLIAMLIISSYSLKAQNLIAVQHGNTPSFYKEVNDAIANSQDGDTIYIPGGTWNISQAINKRLCIIGVGYNLDSTIATFPTTLNGNITLAAGATLGTLTGILLNGNLTATNDPINSYTITRCHITNGITLNQTDSNFIFIQNIIEGNLGSPTTPTNFLFLNNIIIGIFAYWHWQWNEFYPGGSFINSIFNNNIFLDNSFSNGPWWFSFSSVYSLIKNNIFIGSTADFGGVANSIAKNNLFVENISFPNGTNIGSYNIVNQPQSSIFVNQSGNSFSYTQDYHLQPSCPGKNAGTDGTDIGIYGGQFPWKDGSVPFNPHVIISNIGDNTNSNGALPVNIKVAAQDH